MRERSFVARLERHAPRAPPARWLAQGATTPPGPLGLPRAPRLSLARMIFWRLLTLTLAMAANNSAHQESLGNLNGQKWSQGRFDLTTTGRIPTVLSKTKPRIVERSINSLN